MKKLQTIFLALLILTALAAILTGTASAEVTLLAEWLVSGASIPSGTEEASETSSSIEMEDTDAASGVLCTGILDGTVGANGLDLITKILNLAKEEISSTVLTGLALLGPTPDCVSVKGCSTTAALEVWPIGLPWHTLLYLMESGVILDRTAKENGINFGYELACTVLGLKVTDTCEAKESAFEVINDADTGDASIPAGALGEPLANCTIGGSGTGANRTDELSPVTLTGGLLLTVSSE